MDIEMKLKDVVDGDLETALSAIQFFDEYLKGLSEVDDNLVHSLINGLAHRVWMVRSQLFDLFLKHQNKIYPFISEYLTSDNEDIQYWGIQIYCSVAKKYHERASKETNEEKRGNYEKFVERNVKRLTTIYSEVSEPNRKIILSGLSKIRYNPLIHFFVEQLNSPSWLLRNECASALIEMGESAIPHLKKLILNGTRDQCYWSFKALGQLLGERALEPFFRVISSPDYEDEIRIYALSGLKDIDCPEVVEYLIRCLSTDLWVIRAQASETLISLRSRATDSLIKCLKSRDTDLRFWALKTLSDVVVEEDISKIEGFIKNKDQELRFYTISALSSIASARSIKIITECFCDDAWLLRRHAADSLIQIGEPCIQPLLKILRDEQDNSEKVFWTLKVLSALKFQAVLPALAQLLLSDNKDYRLYAVKCISQIPSQKSMQILVEAFANDQWIVRQECYKELSKNRSVYAYIECLRHLNDENDSIHYWSSKFLMESRRTGIVSLVKELQDKDCQTIRSHISDLELLQPQYIEEIFDSSMADLAMMANYLSDSYKRLENTNHKAETISKTDSSYSPIIEKDISAPSISVQTEHLNYFHFEQSSEFLPYEIDLSAILEKLVYLGGSDLHLKVDQAPMVRINGKIQAMSLPPIDANQLRLLLRNSFNASQQRKFCEKKQLDCSFQHSNGERFRVNLYLSHRGIEGAFRHVKSSIPSFTDLGLPEDQFERIAMLESGLVLITGVTGAGKSSTLASIIGAINQRQSKHIICIEDPIEYLHQNMKSVISHRQIGDHVDTFVDGLSACLREDPDVVLVGEMRDTETIKSVLKLAGTGHLVFSTFHTESAPQTIEQIVQFFPPDERQSICSQLSFCLRLVVSQILVEDNKALGRVPVLEIMSGTSAVKNMIREGKTEQLFSVMQTSGGEGMITRDQYLKTLFSKSLISRETMDLHRRDSLAMR